MALYLKYRPQVFSSVIGQDHIIQTLTNQVAGNKLSHAYLFSGPRGVGKTTIARILAKAVNCPNREDHKSEPCNTCNSCQEISESRSIDVIEIDAASHTGVDNVRENIIENAQFKPTRSKFKIFIIDEVHMLSTSAFNALLKTLEEPPAHVIFILATTELHKLPETIISRCQRFEFKKVLFETMAKHLENIAKEEKIKIDKEVIERLINKGDGCVRDTVSLLDQLMASGDKHLTLNEAALLLPNTNIEQTFNFTEKLINQEMSTTLEYLNQLAEQGINFNQFAHDTIMLLRTIMIAKASSQIDSTLDLNDKVKKELRKILEKISYADIIKLIDLILLRAGQIKSSPLPQLPLELAVIAWCDKNDANLQIIANTTNEKKEIKEIKETKTDEPKKTIVERVKDLVSNTTPFDLNQLNTGWGKFMEQIEKRFPTLSFILKMAEIKNVENNTVILTVEYSFHKDKLTEKQTQHHLEDTLSQILNTRARIEVLVVEKQEQPQNQELAELASSLGGQIVN